MTDDTLQGLIANTKGEKVHMQDIIPRIREVRYLTLEALDCPTVTLCNIVLDNGYSVRGESACVDPVGFNRAIGETLAYKQAFDKLWALFGFQLAEQRHARVLAQHSAPNVAG